MKSQNLTFLFLPKAVFNHFLCSTEADRGTENQYFEQKVPTVNSRAVNMGSYAGAAIGLKADRKRGKVRTEDQGIIPAWQVPKHFNSLTSCPSYRGPISLPKCL